MHGILAYLGKLLAILGIHIIKQASTVNALTISFFYENPDENKPKHVQVHEQNRSCTRNADSTKKKLDFTRA